ATVL
ncbi:putative glutathione S-transferase, partial [Vibrio parahaemolyticus EKP-028]